MKLFPLYRPGLFAVSGTVTAVESTAVTLAGSVYLPASDRTVKRYARLRYPRGFNTKNMRLKKGEKLVAICGTNYAAEALFYGAETPDEVYDFNAYQLRYTGAFDFEERDDVEEEHVFAGKVLEAYQYQTPREITTVKLLVHSSGKDLVKNIILDGMKEHTPGEYLVIATKKSICSGEEMFYPAKE